jgi:LacI family transcriptional regulator, repressor for deo operon, udp, cdd, tsx, nupC, and nupG
MSTNRSHNHPATIEAVAALAKVSVATVSRAMRDLPNVAEATRARVRHAAEELNYRPDPNVSRLATGRNNAVGMAVPMLGRWYFSTVIGAAHAVLVQEGYDLLLFGVGGPDDRSRFITEWAVIGKRVDAVILVDLKLDPNELEDLVHAEARVGTVGDRHAPFSSVTIDNRGAAAVAVRHLLNLGHRDIALIGHVEGGWPFTVPTERRAGYFDAHKEFLITPRPELERPGGFDVEGGYEAMTDLLALALPPTAVFAMSDEMAFGAIKAIRDHGLRVPEDLSVVGFDDHEMAKVMDLTTIRQPVAESGTEIARQVVRTLKAVSSGDSEDPGPVHRTLRSQLIVRRTTAPFTGGRPRA